MLQAPLTPSLGCLTAFERAALVVIIVVLGVISTRYKSIDGAVMIRYWLREASSILISYVVSISTLWWWCWLD